MNKSRRPSALEVGLGLGIAAVAAGGIKTGHDIHAGHKARIEAAKQVPKDVTQTEAFKRQVASIKGAKQETQAMREKKEQAQQQVLEGWRRNSPDGLELPYNLPAAPAKEIRFTTGQATPRNEAAAAPKIAEVKLAAVPAAKGSSEQENIVHRTNLYRDSHTPFDTMTVTIPGKPEAAPDEVGEEEDEKKKIKPGKKDSGQEIAKLDQ